jgi:HEAT repeat protein
MSNEINMEFKESKNYQDFYDHVFGDYRYYYHNDLSEDTCTCLEGLERIKAEKLVLQSIKKIVMDERAIRAAGYLKMQSAVPVLKKRLNVINIFMRRSIRSSIVWALLKIEGNKASLDKILGVLNNGLGLDGLTRPDAADLLSNFGKERLALDTLLHAFMDQDIFVRASALHALRKIFRDNEYASNLLGISSFAFQASERISIIKQIEKDIGG